MRLKRNYAIGLAVFWGVFFMSGGDASTISLSDLYASQGVGQFSAGESRLSNTLHHDQQTGRDIISTRQLSITGAT